MASEFDVLLLYLYVNDIIYMGSSVAMLTEFKEDMVRMFKMIDLGFLKNFLGLEVKQLESSIHVCQK